MTLKHTLQKCEKVRNLTFFFFLEAEITCENLPLWIRISFLTNLRYVISFGIPGNKMF